MRSFSLISLLALATTSAWAAEGGHGSVTDLIAPAVNVALLAGFLIWKLKGPLSQHFTAKSEEVANTIERASIKSKEAQMMLENEQRKQASLAAEITAINQQNSSDIATFEKNLARETEDKSHKLKADANSKIQADRKAMMDALNAELLNQVISKTKSTIKGNKDYQSKVSNKLLQGLKQ